MSSRGARSPASVAAYAAALGLRPRDLNMLRDVFNLVDLDRDGCISVSELGVLLERLGVRVPLNVSLATTLDFTRPGSGPHGRAGRQELQQ